MTHQEESGIPKDLKPVQPDDEITYECTQCGACCRMGNQFVMLDTHDVFNLSQYFKKADHHIWRMDELLTEYTTPIPLTDGGYPVFILNTVGTEKECVFLKNGRCSVQDAKPYTCRAYPLTIGPGKTANDLNYYVCEDRPRHFTGRKRQIADLVAESLSLEDREFLIYEYSLAVKLGRKLRKINSDQMKQVMFPLFLYKYYDFDVDAPFMPQYTSNMEKLLAALECFTEEQSGE